MRYPLRFCFILASFFLSILFPRLTHAGFIRSIVFPVDGTHRFQDDFGDPRYGGREHLGNDIMASKMTPVVAAVDAVVDFIVDPEESWGYAIFLRDAEGWSYRYIHLNNDTPGTDDGNGGTAHAYAPGISRGTQVEAGQHIGWVGDSGNAEGTAAHLHFEIRQPDGIALNPYESLRAAAAPATVTTQPAVVTTIVVPRSGELIRSAGAPEVYLLAQGVKYHIADEQTFHALGYSWSAVRVTPATEEYRTGLPIRIAAGTIATYDDGTPIVSTAAVKNEYIFTQTLSLGSRGAEVNELQRVLKNLGLYHYASITGYFGPMTRDAVIAFQKKYGIDPVGYVGSRTRAALNAL